MNSKNQSIDNDKSEKEPFKIEMNSQINKSKYLIKLLKKTNYNLLISCSFFFLSYYLYYKSLEKCFQGFDICGTKNNWISLKLSEAVLSSFILALLIESMIYRIVSKFHLIHTIIFYYLIFNYSHGLDFQDHGFYNFFGCIFIIFLILILMLPLNGLIFFIKKKNYIYILIYLFSTIFFIIMFYYIFFIHYMNCNNWEKGLNNTYIENNKNKYACNIIFPKICQFKLGMKFFDITNLNGVNCNKKKENTKLKLLKFSNHKNINNQTKRIGFPLLNKDKRIFLAIKDNDNKIYKYASNYLTDMDNEDLVNKIFKNNYPEIIIDYTNNQYGELIINITFNETLSKERKLLEKNSLPFSENIMIIYIDSVSRANSIRKLKKSLKFIEKFMSFKGGYHPRYPSENYHSFQFFKYHSFTSYTRNNYMQLFYGNSYGSVNEKKMVRITKYLKENGYITSYINDMCLREPTNTGHNMDYEEIGDHEWLICDPNMKSVHSHTIRCLYNKLSTEYAYEYGNQFWRKYKNNRKFLSIITNDGHEGTLEVIKYIDDALFNFLNNLYNDNLFKNSSIFLLSDHGTAAPSPYYITNFYQIERHLPMLYIICNDRKNISYDRQYQYIHKNQQILITGYDIYNTIGNLIFGDKYNIIPNKTKIYDTPKTNLGISLFNEINPKTRTPKKYKNMDKNFCV